MANKTVISVTKPTPKYATWIFRVVFVLTTAATFVIASDPAIPDDLKVRIGVYLKGLDMIVWGIGRFLGIEKDDNNLKQ